MWGFPNGSVRKWSTAPAWNWIKPKEQHPTKDSHHAWEDRRMGWICHRHNFPFLSNSIRSRKWSIHLTRGLRPISRDYLIRIHVRSYVSVSFSPSICISQTVGCWSSITLGSQVLRLLQPQMGKHNSVCSFAKWPWHEHDIAVWGVRWHSSKGWVTFSTSFALGQIDVGDTGVQGASEEGLRDDGMPDAWF